MTLASLPHFLAGASSPYMRSWFFRASSRSPRRCSWLTTQVSDLPLPWAQAGKWCLTWGCACLQSSTRASKVPEGKCSGEQAWTNCGLGQAQSPTTTWCPKISHPLEAGWKESGLPLGHSSTQLDLALCRGVWLSVGLAGAGTASPGRLLSMKPHGSACPFWAASRWRLFLWFGRRVRTG